MDFLRISTKKGIRNPFDPARVVVGPGSKGEEIDAKGILEIVFLLDFSFGS